jgi:acetyl-CoA C-acetyltransferase
LQALRTAAHTITVREAEVILVVGVESVSRVGRGLELAKPNPLLDPTAAGDTVGAIFMPMGLTAELVADDHGITRAEMDAYAKRSQDLAYAAQVSGFSVRKITPVALPTGGELSHDESIRPGTTLEKLGKLPPVFREGGRVTAGNSCTLNDGAAAALVMAAHTANTLGVEPIARILASAVSAVDPSRMGVGPIEAVRRVLKTTGLRVDDLDVIELNEAFAAQVIPVLRSIEVDPFDDRVNPFGGAIAIGHPFGMTGLRMVSTLLNGLRERDGTIGLVTMCVGGGQGEAMVIERL